MIVWQRREKNMLPKKEELLDGECGGGGLKE